MPIAGVLSLILLGLSFGPVNAQHDGKKPVDVTITARQFEFEPRRITVQKGQPVSLVITSTDVAHGFAIDEFEIDESIEEKRTKTIKFTPDRAGRFRFYCSLYCGKGHDDMAGELVVEETQTARTGIKVTFDDHAPGVAIVESNGERLRIDASTKTVTRIEEESKPAPAQSEVAEAERTDEHATEELPREPFDYRLVNVPTPKRVLRGSLNLYFTHRFTQPLRPLSQSDEDLLGLDSFAVSSLGVFYGVTDRLYVSAYRSPICQAGLCKTIEFGVGYHLLDEHGRSPVALSTYASVEGDENFKRNYTYNLQLMMARSATKYVHLFFSPALHLNANGQRRFDPRPEDFFPAEPLANQFRQDKHGGSFGFGASARIRPTISLMFEYTPRVGFKLARVVPVFAPGTGRITEFVNESEAGLGFGIEKDIGRHTFSLTFSNTQGTTTSRYNSSNLVLPPSRFIIGFNLYRRFLR